MLWMWVKGEGVRIIGFSCIFKDVKEILKGWSIQELFRRLNIIMELIR